MIRPIILSAFLLKKNNKYLLAQEATDKVKAGVKTFSKGKWTLPHGEVDKKETILEAAKRELLEETGIKVKTGRLGCVGVGVIDQTVSVLMFVFYAKEFAQVNKRRKNEISKSEFFTRKQIKELKKNNLIRSNLPVLKVIQTIEKNGKVEFINWVLPDYVKQIFQKLDRKR